MKCLSIIICEEVIQDLRTQNKSYINTFNTIVTNRLPEKYKKMCVVCSLTELDKQCSLTISLKADEKGVELFSIYGELSPRNPLNVLDLVFTIRDIPLIDFGNYSLELLLNDCFVASRRFTVCNSTIINNKGEK